MAVKMVLFVYQWLGYFLVWPIVGCCGGQIKGSILNQDLQFEISVIWNLSVPYSHFRDSLKNFNTTIKKCTPVIPNQVFIYSRTQINLNKGDRQFSSYFFGLYFSNFNSKGVKVDLGFRLIQVQLTGI